MTLHRLVNFLIAAVLLASCAETKYVPEGRYLLDNVKVEIDGDYDDLSVGKAKSYIRQQDNARWFSLVKLPLRTYSLSGRDTTKWVNQALRKIGEPPVLYDATQAMLTSNDLRQMLFNMGYLDAKVELWTHSKDKKLSVLYKLIPGTAYQIGHLNYQIADNAIDKKFHLSDSVNWKLKVGQQFNVDNLDMERKRITKLLNDNGYYRFHQEFITYEADTLEGGHHVNLNLNLGLAKNRIGIDTLHTQYSIRNVTYEATDDSVIPIRPRVLKECTYIKAHD